MSDCKVKNFYQYGKFYDKFLTSIQQIDKNSQLNGHLHTICIERQITYLCDRYD